ncbi:MAG: amino acid ABC transporter substrate-binding protein [Rhodospirillaceae bacterium]|nr:amino acid ABC transporter substrate-binding protein [Rhodospirillaceae bacterium]|tara:strand:+ start:546 stop:1340 length:795 start_codon:yes stop_codon:yes gene_type:complete
MMRIPKLLGLGIFAFGLMAFTQAAASDVLKDIVKRGQLRVAVQTQGPPVSFIDKHDKRTGFAIEVVKMMAKDMGVELKLLDYEWKGLIPAVNSGKADFLAADMTPNAKRTLVLSFTEPYLYSDVVLYSKKSQPFKKWQDACKKGVAVGVVQGSSNVGLLKKICSAATIKEFAGGGAAVAQAVAADRVDAGINDQASAAGYMVEYTDFHVLEGAPKRWPLSFATRPDETHLLRWMDNYFMLIRNDGRLEQLADYWMRGPTWKKDH